mgnify:CR=1 FL=1
MKVIGVIPARLNATRFPGKPMAKIHGMPMVEHCYHRTRLTPGISSTFVATCDDEIAKHINEIGGNSILTSDSHTRATTRTAEAMQIIEEKFREKIDILVMVQGDEPLIKPETIAKTLSHFKDSSVEIVNIMSRLDSYDQFIDKNNVKVVVDYNSDALYFSREPIPSPWKGIKNLSMYMQTGIIAFRREALLKFNSMDETLLEQTESIDMNRVLEMGGSIRMVATESRTIGVDTPQELKDSEELMRNDSTLAQYQTL